jgi:Rieske Fe-S protein
MTQDQRTPVNPEGSPEAGCARRSVLRGALALGAVGLGGGLSACGGGSSDSASQSSGTPGSGTSGSGSSGPTTGGSTTSGPTTASTPTPAATSSGSTAASGGGTSLGPASGVPVGGGTVYATAKVVVTQPSMGQYKGFSAVCTHEGCTVGDVSTTINCPCHGSQFSITDGSVIRGPAKAPLPAKTVTVSGGNVSFT